MVQCPSHGHMCRHCSAHTEPPDQTSTSADIPINSVADAETEIAALFSEVQSLTATQELTNDLLHNIVVKEHKQLGYKDSQKKNKQKQGLWEVPVNGVQPSDSGPNGGDSSKLGKRGNLLKMSNFHHYFDNRAWGRVRKPGSDENDHAVRGSAFVRVMNGKTIDIVSSIVVIFNTVLIGIKTDIGAGAYGKVSDVDTAVLENLSLCCLAFFFCEVVLRFACAPKDFFVGHDCGWNWFDTTVISVGIAEEVLFHAPTAGAAANGFIGARAFRLLRIMRVVRVLRIARGFRQLRLLVKGILGSFKALFWTIILVLLGFLVFAILMVRLLQEDILNSEACSDEESQICEVYQCATFYFPSVERSLFTLFGFMTDGWVDVAVVLIKRHTAIWIFFVIFITLSSIAVLNIVTGVFVEQTLAAGREDEENIIRDQLAQKNSFTNELKKFFELADTDKNGFLTWKEFEKDLQNPRVVAQLQNLELNVDEAKGLFKLIDVDGNGSVSIDEFIMGACRVKGTAKAVDVVTIMYESAKMVEQMREFELEFNLKLDRLATQTARESAKNAAFKASMDSKLGLLTQKIEQRLGW